MDKQFTTPMLKQFQELKKQNPDCLLFFRLGDFYELFCEDATIGAKILDITLTARPGGRDGRVPMAGVPYHAADSYLSKLVKAGYKVAICEQVSLPNKNGLVDREVVRIVTPGTMLDERSLDQNQNNFIISLSIDNQTIAVAAADVSTGTFQVSEFSVHRLEETIKDILSRLNPVECILSEKLYHRPEILKLLRYQTNLNIYPFLNWEVYAKNATRVLKQQLKVVTLESYHLQDSPLIIESAAALVGYLQETQKHSLDHIKTITKTTPTDHVVLDRSTIANLELFASLRNGEVKSSLIAILDQTKTPMGGRMLRQWLKYPLTKKEAIDDRLDAVEEWTKEVSRKESIRETLGQIADIERIISRLSVGLGNARDLVNIKNSLIRTIEIKAALNTCNSTLNLFLSSQISETLNVVVTTIDRMIIDEPPIDTKQGGMIKTGVSQKLDELRDAIGGSKTWLANLEQIEREKTGISSLKVRSNKVFGFYIEVSKSNLHLIPSEYSRKQTLVNAERYITAELKEQEEHVLSAEDEIHALELQLYNEVVSVVMANIQHIQQAAESIAKIDCLTTFAVLARSFDYHRPKLLYSGEVRIKSGRHPVVERVLEDHQFVPNDVSLDNIHQPLLVITGPNMAGKSVLIRQVAIIVLMAHIGCFVPAEEAHVSLVDKIFVRSGASDAIGAGLSTFMVEMVETAHILHTMTEKSLIIMDEIGRGTSTYDGISIAWAIAEYIVTFGKPAPKTLFATHYHELQELSKTFPNKIKNYHMAVVEQQGTPIFLYTLQSGPAPHSFGVAVAKLAGVPEAVINRANQMLAELENKREEIKTPAQQTVNTDSSRSNVILQKISQLDLSTTTPLTALNTLAEIQMELKKTH